MGQSVTCSTNLLNKIYLIETKSVVTLRWPGQLHEGGAGLPGKEEQEPREGNVDEWWEVREARSSGVLPKLSVA